MWIFQWPFCNWYLVLYCVFGKDAWWISVFLNLLRLVCKICSQSPAREGLGDEHDCFLCTEPWEHSFNKCSYVHLLTTTFLSATFLWDSWMQSSLDIKPRDLGVHLWDNIYNSWGIKHEDKFLPERCWWLDFIVKQTDGRSAGVQTSSPGLWRG